MYAGVEDPQQILADPVGVGFTAMTPVEITSIYFSRTLSTVTPFPAAGLVSCGVLSRYFHQPPPVPPLRPGPAGGSDAGVAPASPARTV
jgi:hypothetical protein